MSSRRVSVPTSPEPTACTVMFAQLQDLWDEIGESNAKRDEMILELECECLNVYKRKVDQTRKYKADLHQQLAEVEAEASTIISALGERELYAQIQKPKGALKEQLVAIIPWLDGLRHKREERVKEFKNVQIQIFNLSSEIAGRENSTETQQFDEKDLTLKKLEELKLQLQELQNDKNNRLQKVSIHTQLIYDLTNVMSIDFNKRMGDAHSSFVNSLKDQPKSISNISLTRLVEAFHSLEQEKKLRLEKLKYFGTTLIDLWNLMDTTMDEREKFNHVIYLKSVSEDVFLDSGSLALEVIEHAEKEVEKLNILKASKMRELILKKQTELEEIYKSVCMDFDIDSTNQMLVNLIESGVKDLSEVLSDMDVQIANAKEQALSRKDILDRVEKWKHSCSEETWLDDYEMDQNRYSAGRGAHKNLQRAEKARALVNKLPSMVENLMAKVKSWEQDKGMLFLYEKTRLFVMLQEYKVSRQQKEDGKRRSREHKRIQEQFVVEQEARYGSKPTPLRQFPAKKPLGQSCNVNVVSGVGMMMTPKSRRISTQFGKSGSLLASSTNKERKAKLVTPIPSNYVSILKEDPLFENDCNVNRSSP
ncbi:65-kDa microtubule-associated protein 5 [Zostera marina]|uniref:65-kDa microtubule-associated protein 5 n=1 Tax=Zostera marina TaxID=29655 RepID=A0A0K9PG86_ZOSMR|nr:65-kDa microtubule-associated protein 5 [Zostera marina]